MKKMLLVWVAAAAGLLPSLSLTNDHPRNLDDTSVSYSLGFPADPELLARVPGTALLAVSVSDMDQRWGEIRNTRTLAHFQDALLSGSGLHPDLIPRLVGRHSVFFFAPADRWPFAVPVGLFAPDDPAEAQGILEKLPDVRYLRDGALFWVAPAAAEDVLLRVSSYHGPSFWDVVPCGEASARLPAGGLVRGFVNSAACLKLLHESAIDGCPFPLRHAAAALAADLAAVRYVAFRRDLLDGAITTDGLVSCDPTRLPPELAPVFNPDASPVLLPAWAPLVSRPNGSVPSPFLVVAFRPESDAWMPWIRYVSASDRRGPLRNLSFWLEEFQQRYARNLRRDLFSAIGDHGWLLAALDSREDSVEVALVLELQSDKAIEGILDDLCSWTNEQLWLSGLILRTPLTPGRGPTFEVAGRYLVIALQPSGIETGREWIRSIETAKATERLDTSATYGALVVQPGELARVIRGARPTLPDSNPRLWDALIGLMADAGTLRVDMTYEADGIRFHGRLPLGVE